MPPAARSLRSRISPWLWAGGTVALVAATGLATWHFTRGQRAPTAPAVAAEAAQPARLVEGHDYYLHVKLIELAERMPGDKPWDRLDGSGPDICFSLTWRQNVVWKSIEKPNTLIGSWDLLKVDLRQMVTGGQTDLEGLVNAPLIHYGKGESAELTVWDSDTVGSDDAGSITIRFDDLRLGENALQPSGERAKSLKRVVVAVIDRRTSLPDLVNTISNR